MQILTEKGYTDAYALLGGTAVWKNAGFPMEGEVSNTNSSTNNTNNSGKK